MISFANNSGGLLIIGISDKSPRVIHGLDDLEGKINQLSAVMRSRISLPQEIVEYITVNLTDESRIKKKCLILAIAQSKEVLGVKVKEGVYLYKKRIGASSMPVTLQEIMQSKIDIKRNNYDFLERIKRFID